MRYDAVNGSKLAHVVQRKFLNYIQLGDIRELNSYAYAEEQINSGKWLIDAGVRFDYLRFAYLDRLNTSLPPQGKGVISPKLNVNYSVSNQVQLYIKTGKGFHSNDVRVVIAQRGQKILPAAYATDLGII